MLVSVAMHSIPTVPTDEISAISGEFDALMLFLFTVPSSLRRLNSESKSDLILDELLLKVFVTKSDSVYILVESLVLKPI